MLLNTVPFILFVLIDAYKRKQTSLFKIVVQSSFYVYVFSVFYLTLFPLTTTTIFTSPYWIRINVVPFNIFNDFHFLDRQIIGNFIMLMPLGIYLHIMFGQFRNTIKPLVVILLVTLLIEIIQLIFLTGSADIDDVILNLVGGLVAFFGVKKGINFYKKNISKSVEAPAN